MKARMKMRQALAIAVLAAGFGAWIHSTPYIAANSLREAARAGDLATMLEHIDVFAVKNNFKADLLAMLQERVDSTEGLPFGEFGAALAATMLEPAVAVIVTPSNLALMVQGHMPNLDMEPWSSHDSIDTKVDTEVRMEYQGLSKFSVSVVQMHGARDSITLLFQRESLFTWRLQSLWLPFARHAQRQQAAEAPRP